MNHTWIQLMNLHEYNAWIYINTTHESTQGQHIKHHKKNSLILLRIRIGLIPKSGIVPWSKKCAAINTVPSPPTAIIKSTSAKCCRSNSTRLMHKYLTLFWRKMESRDSTHCLYGSGGVIRGGSIGGLWGPVLVVLAGQFYILMFIQRW